MIEKFRRLINSQDTPLLLIWISILIDNLPMWLRSTWLIMGLSVIAGLLSLRIAAKQPLPLWGEEEIKRWEVIRAGGERQFMLAPGIIILTFLTLYVFLLINIVAIWDHSLFNNILEIDVWYSAIAIVLWSLIYITRKGLWSLREKNYKALLDSTPPSNNSMRASPQTKFE